MSNELIRDRRNVILGRIETRSNGERIAHANNGNVLGYYTPGKGTRDPQGRHLSLQDMTVALVWKQNG